MVVLRLGAISLALVFVKQSFLAVRICRGPGIEQKKPHLPLNVLNMIAR